MAIGSIALLLTACGDDITEQINANVGAVETSKDLPECSKDIAGQTAFVAETHEFLGCDGKEWQTLRANTVSVGDNVCSATSLSDDSGFEIFCNGESIGKVRNGKDGSNGINGAPGEKGDNGSNGKDGTGCKIQESTTVTATIACGSETFTMDLTGYVDVSEECDAEKYEDCTGSLENVDLSGVSQKGPFVIGTDITAYELENGRSLKQTGKTFGGKIEKADGTFDIKTVKLKSTFAYIVADGFYRNEVTGENSASAIKLRAFTNLQGRTSANINLVTHLEYDRVQYLVTRKDSSVAKAKMAAEKEIFKAFGIDNSGFGGFAEDFNILQEGDGNAALLAISALLQGDRSEAQLTALLASLSVDLGDNGVWDNKKERAQVADWAMKKDLEGGLAKIRANIKAWKLHDGEPPAFEAPFRHFWITELEVPDCTKDSAGRLFAVKKMNSAFYAAKDSAYTEGDSSLVRLICDASGETPAWRLATDIEKDTAAFAKDLSADTAVAGKINTDFVYVKDGDWRRGTELDKTLKFSCVANKKGVTDNAIVMRDTTWYICDKNDDASTSQLIPTVWRKATTAEADTAGFGIPETEKDSVKIGNINKSRYYVYEEYKWRFGTELDFGLGPCIEDKLGNVKNLVEENKPEDPKDPNLWYICVDNEYMLVEDFRVPTTWRKASDLEMDTYSWTDVVEEGSVRNGAVNSNLTYVFENGKWRHGTRMDNVLGLSCTLKNRDTLVEESQFVWYKCFADTADDLTVSSSWRRVVESELDRSYWNCFKDTLGTFLVGPYSGKTMVWDNGMFREPNEREGSLGRACVNYMNGGIYEVPDGTPFLCENTGWSQTPMLRDSRDSNLYRATKIGSQVWMAENLNYETKDSYCYDDFSNYCTRYGRLYIWGAAMDSAGTWSTNGKGCGYGRKCSPTGTVRGVCPEGWHLPSSSELDTLISNAGGASAASKKLRSTSGWNFYGVNGTDDYAFSALPAGYRDDAGVYTDEGRVAAFWKSEENDADEAELMYLSYNFGSVRIIDDPKNYAYSVRCVKDKQ